MSVQQAINHLAGNTERLGIPVKALAEAMIKDSGNITARSLGKSSNNLDDALADFQKARTVVLGASDALQKQCLDSSRQVKEAVSRAKDAAAQMTDAMNKITKMIGPDFEKRLVQIERLTDCMERLNALNTAGKLTSVMDALRS